MAAQSVSRCTAPTVAMPCPPACLSRSRKCWNRRPRIGCRGASTGCPRNPGCHWAIPGKPLSATERPASATGPTGPRPMRRARRQCPGLWTTGHRENSRHARHWTPPGGAGRSVLFGPAYRLAQSLPRRKPGISSPPRATRPCPANCVSWTASTSCSSTISATCSRVPRG